MYRYIISQIQDIELPEYLYHATYEQLLESIKKSGLGNTNQTFWEDSKPRVVYLADDEYIAESYAETNENVDEDWLDEIIILRIRTEDLDIQKLYVDENVIDGDTTYEYHSIIPWKDIEIL